MRRRLALLAVAAVGTVLMSTVAPAAAEEDEEIIHPIDISHSVLDAPAPVTGGLFDSPAGQATPGQAICTTATSTAANVNTDCEPNTPHNETSIAVNPTNPLNMIGGANDFQLALNPGGHVSQSVISRARVTFDGGRTWSEFPINANSAYQATGDPAVAFDASGHAYFATLGFRFVGPTSGQNPDILVSDSADGGRTWRVSRVATGSGTFGSVGDLLDKEFVAAWGTGNAIVTYGDFRLGQHGSIQSGRIFSSVTHDFGATWSTPQPISGNLDQSFVSVPTVAADGRVYVAFENTDDLSTGRDGYHVVEVSPATGARVAGPFLVGGVIDGFTDYPIAAGRQTYQDSAFRSWSAGNITADPTNAAHLAVVWSDMRNSVLPAPANPYAAVTNSDVIVSQSFDRGRTWSAATALARSGDQFMPWGAFDASGRLRIGTFDRGTDPANHRYDFSIATQTTATAFAFAPISTATSNPTRDNLWFAATLNPAFPAASLFIGDYAGIAVVPGTTRVVAYWTDLRETACFAGACGHGQNAYFASTS